MNKIMLSAFLDELEKEAGVIRMLGAARRVIGAGSSSALRRLKGTAASIAEGAYRKPLEKALYDYKAGKHGIKIPKGQALPSTSKGWRRKRHGLEADLAERSGIEKAKKQQLIEKIKQKEDAADAVAKLPKSKRKAARGEVKEESSFKLTEQQKKRLRTVGGVGLLGVAGYGTYKALKPKQEQPQYYYQ
jgi:hypothetical protein